LRKSQKIYSLPFFPKRGIEKYAGMKIIIRRQCANDVTRGKKAPARCRGLGEVIIRGNI